MHRSFSDDWRVDAFDRRFVGNIIDISADAPIDTINFSQICRWDMYKPATEKRECCRCCGGQGIHSADISKPGILLRGKNPAGLPYRLLDGRHRVWAMEAMGYRQAPFKIIELDVLKPYLKIVLE